MGLPSSLKESDDLGGDLGGNLGGEPHLHAKSDDRGTRDFSKFWRCNTCLATLGNDSVGAASPLLDEARPVKALGDNRIALNRIVLTGQVVWGDPQWESAGAPYLDPIIEDRQRHSPASDRIVTVDQRVHHDLAQR